MQEKTLLLSTVLILLLSFFSSSTAFTGQFYSRLGYYVPTYAESPNLERYYLVCDVDGDGNVDGQDLLLVQGAVDGTNPSYAASMFADVNNDGVKDQLDIQLVSDCLEKKRATLLNPTIRGNECTRAGAIQCTIGLVGAYRVCEKDETTGRLVLSSKTYSCPGGNECRSLTSNRLVSRVGASVREATDRCVPRFTG